LDIAGSNKGYKHSEETKAKLSLIKTGLLRSEIDKEKISLANKGRILLIFIK